MRHNRRQEGVLFLTWLLIMVFNIVVGGYCAEYTVAFWTAYFKGGAVHLPFLIACGIGLFFGEFFTPAAIFTWLVSGYFL